MVSARIDIESLIAWIELRFDRSSGPGGQNVNKLSTRVTLLLDFQACPQFTAAQKGLIARRLESRLASDGRLRVVCQRERSQRANMDLAMLRLGELLEEATHVPRPRSPTRPSRASRERRLAAKRRRAATKRERRGEDL